MAKSKPTKMLAVLGRCRRTGRWRLASKSSVLAVLGLCHLDMRDSFVDDEQLKMTVTVFLGTATFIVPNGAEVRPSGMSLLGASTVDVPEHDDTSELPTLEIEWTSIFGRIRIVSEDLIDAEGGQAPTQAAIAAPVVAAAALPAPAVAAPAAIPAVTGAPTQPAAEPSAAPAATATPQPSSHAEPVSAGADSESAAAAADIASEPSAEVAPEAQSEAAVEVGVEVPVAAEVEVEVEVEVAAEPAPEPEPVAVGFEDLD